MSKQYDLLDQIEMSIFHAKKASKIIDQLYMLRKDKYSEYQVMLAAFYYKVGDALCTYIELNTDEMNQLKPLNLPEDPDDYENEELEAVAEEAEEEKASVEAKSDAIDEPIIEDVTDQIDSSTKKEEAPQVQQQEKLGENNELEDLS